MTHSVHLSAVATPPGPGGEAGEAAEGGERQWSEGRRQGIAEELVGGERGGAAEEQRRQRKGRRGRRRRRREKEEQLLRTLELEAVRFQRTVQEVVEAATNEHLWQQEQILARWFSHRLDVSSPAGAVLGIHQDTWSAEDTAEPEAVAPATLQASGADEHGSGQGLALPVVKAESETTVARWRSRDRERVHELQAAQGSRIHAFLLKHCRPWLIWWWGLEEPKRTGRLAGFLTGHIFSSLLAIVICLNAVVTAAVVNHDICCNRVPKTLRIWEACIVNFFAVEVVLKLWVHRLYYFVGPDAAWNVFDLVLAVLSTLQFVLFRLVSAQSDSQGTFLRMVRALRFTRVLRGLKAFRVFSELGLLLKCVIGSVTSMFWSFVMLMFTIFLFSLIVLQTLEPEFEAHHEGRGGVVDTDGAVLLENFGSVQLAMLSLYSSVTGGQDWQFYFAMFPELSTKAVFLAFLFFFNITILNILTGIYVDAAMKHAVPERQARAMDAFLQQIEDQEDLHLFCRQHGIIGHDGIIDRSAFLAACSNEHFAAYLDTFGINSSNPDELYSCLLNLGAPLTADSLVSGLLKLSEPATNYDVERMTQHTRTILSMAANDRSPHIYTVQL